MALSVRRVITANDDSGKAVVWIDEQAANVRYNRPGVESVVVWTTDTVPRPPVRRGTIFRIIEFQPGNTTDMHVTQTIDYALVMSGEIDMELDDGAVVTLKEGDVLVQRATVHNWLNKGPGVCKMAFVLIDATP